MSIRAIGPDGWAVGERMVEPAIDDLVRDAADGLRSFVRSQTGWLPRLVVLDEHGRDVSAEYGVE